MVYVNGFFDMEKAIVVSVPNNTFFLLGECSLISEKRS